MEFVVPLVNDWILLSNVTGGSVSDVAGSYLNFVKPFAIFERYSVLDNWRGYESTYG